MKTNYKPVLAMLKGWKFKGWIVCGTALISFAAGSLISAHLAHLSASSADLNRDDQQWIGTWATAPQPAIPRNLQTFRNQSLRLIVHTSAGGTKVRIRISNT